MILEKSMSAGWLSNTWLVGDEPGGKAVLIDTGGSTAPILDAIRRHRLELTHILCTHHHLDHTAHNAEYRKRFHCPVCGHRAERDLFGGLDLELAGDEELTTGGLHFRALHLPGHTAGQLGFLLNDEAVFTGDTLFRRSVGGTMAPGHTTFEDLRNSVMEVLMALPPATRVLPGHTETSTIGEEWEENPFIRMWRDLDPPGSVRCKAFGRPGTLLLDARDYDGGRKCWVRFDDGTLDLVPGSRVRCA